MKYVALLRGINVGGNKKVPMADLKKVFKGLGFNNVKTLLNTGNVVFESNSKVESGKIEDALKKYFGFNIPVILELGVEVQKLIARNPFKNTSITKDTRLYVSFLSEKPTSTLKLPYVSPEKDFKILEIIHKAIISVLTLSARMKTTVSMGIIEKEYGKNVTTRNWNTVLKIGKLLQ